MFLTYPRMPFLMLLVKTNSIVYFLNHLWTHYLKKIVFTGKTIFIKNAYPLIQFPLKFITDWAEFWTKVADLFAGLGEHWRHFVSKIKEKATLIEMVPYLLTVPLAFLMFCSKPELPQASYRKGHRYRNNSTYINRPVEDLSKMSLHQVSCFSRLFSKV